VLERFSLTEKRSHQYYLYLAIGFYLFRFFPLHELTQLRAALSVAAIFLAATALWEKRRVKGTGFAMIAASLHYSSLMLTPLFYLPRFSRRKAIIISVSAGALLYLASKLMISVAQVYFAVFQTYEFGFAEDMPKPFSVVFFPEFYMIGISLLFWEDLTELMQRIVVLQMLGFAMFYGLIDFSVVAVRGRELYSVLWAIFIVQAAGVPSRFRYLLHIFIVSFAILSFYQYFVLDFFHN
jgi:hypothetical protein